MGQNGDPMQFMKYEASPVPYTRAVLGYEHVCDTSPWVKNFDPDEDQWGFSIDIPTERTRDSRVLIAEVLCVGENTPGNVRLLTSAFSSYARHCRDVAVSCAESDLLGDLLSLAYNVLDDPEAADLLRAQAGQVLLRVAKGGGSPVSHPASVAS